MQNLSAGRLLSPISLPGRGLRSQPRSAPDLFQEVFQSRLSARLAARSKFSSPFKNTGKNNSLEDLRNFGSLREKTRSGFPQSVSSGIRDSSSRTGAGLERQIKPGRSRRLFDSDTSIPIALKSLMEFVAAQPDQTLRVSGTQALQVGAQLLQAGLSREEVENLVFSLGSPDLGLTLSTLKEVWARHLETASSAETPAAADSSESLGVIFPEIQKWLQEPGYLQFWERLRVPRDLLPSLRLALIHLGARPQDLNLLEGDTQEGGVPLSEVWRTLQNTQSATVRPAESRTPGPFGPENGEALTPYESQAVTAEDLATWRQVLLKTGLPPELVEGLLGKKTPGTQEELRAALLALTPKESPPLALKEPKPLYLPQNLRLRTLGWESQAREGRQPGQHNLAEKETYGHQSAPDLAVDRHFDLENAVFAGSPSAYTPSALTSGGITIGGGTPFPATAWPLLSPEMRASVWSQVQSGIITHLSPGETQVNLNLNPPELGQIQLNLRLVGHEVVISGVASRPEVAELAQQGLSQLVQTLAQQGLTLTHFVMQAKEAGGLSLPPTYASSRDKGTDAEGRQSGSTRRHFGGVNRFV
jgi:hypothetical protein